MDTLKKHKGDAEAMAKRVRAILKYYSSTLEHPQHEDCPESENLWCKYQVDAAAGGASYRPVKDPIAPSIMKLFSLCSKSLAVKLS